MAGYDKTIAASAACAVPSPVMAWDYSKKYGTRMMAFLGSLDFSMANPPAGFPKNKPDFAIGFAGQLYATDAWGALLEALNYINWEISGRNVEILLIGNFDPEIKTREAIKLMGRRSLKDTINILSKADIAYCPYWFDGNFEQVARTSFPSKLTAYFAAGRPVFFHGPEYSSPARFIEEHSAGICCYSLRKEEIIEKLILLAGNSEVYEKAARNGRQAFDKYLTLDSLKKSFDEFLTAPFKNQ
jgi:glycosyltransferase involved in cell wall biosynthesis